MTVSDAERAAGTEGAPVEVSPSVYRRLMSGLPGYAFAMAVCLALAGLVMLITPRNNSNALPHVDYSMDLAGLRQVAPYTPYAPAATPAGWYCNSSRLTGRSGGPVAWHLGFITDRDEYVALEQSNEKPDGRGAFVDRMISQGTPDGAVQVAGATWQRYDRHDKKQASLVRRLKGLTLVVTGTAPYDRLAAFAATLRAQ